MAAVEDSPSRCQGQPWMIYAQRTGLSSTNDESGDEKDVKDAREGDAMKLRKEDMPLFGSCPAQEEFYLVVCEECGIVIKPQALRSHIERRHTCNNSVLNSADGGGGSSRSGEYSSSNLVNKLGVKSVEMCRPSSRGSGSGGSSTAAPPSKSCDNNKSNSQLSRFAIPPKQNLSNALSNKIISGLQNKLDSKLESRNALGYSGVGGSSGSGSKKNHRAISPPVVKVDRMLPSGKKVPANNASSNANVSPSSALPSDKRELPSPQQPPPPTTHLSSPDSPYFLDTSPMNIFSNQQQQGLASSPSSSSGSNKNSQAASSSSAHNSSSSVSSVNKKQNSTNNSTSSSSAASNAANNSNETKVKSSKSRKIPKERKLLPCKDRVYDPDKHCGVNNTDGKPCTRSLTCKTHSLAMRRSVPGRRKGFDELLSDHRATKEGTAKTSKNRSVVNNKTAASNAAFDAVKLNATPVSATTSGSANSYLKGSSKVNCSNGGSSHSSTSETGGGGRGCNQRLPINVPSAKSKILNAKNHLSSTPIQRTQSSGNSSQSTSNETQRKSSSFDSLTSSAAQPAFSSVNRSEDDDDGYITHHPKPAAVCTFNSRQMGLGFYVHDRKLDSIRAVLRLALGERISQSPSVKKLCVESKLPPVPESSDPSDPYCFTFGEQTNSISSSVTASCSSSASLTVPPVTSCGGGSSGKSMTLTSSASSSSSSSNASGGATVANTLKSPPILSHSFSMKSSSSSTSQKLGKSCAGNRPVKNRLNKDTSVTNINNNNNNGQNNNSNGNVSKASAAELTKSVRASSAAVAGNANVGGSSLKRKRGSNSNTNNFTYQPLINNNIISNSSGIVMNSPPYQQQQQQQQQSGAAYLQQSTVPLKSPTSNLLSVPFPVGLSVSQLTGTIGGKAAASHPFSVSSVNVSAVGSVAGAGRNHNTNMQVVSGASLKDVVVSEVVNGQLGSGGGGGRNSAVSVTNSGTPVVGPLSNVKPTCVSLTNSDAAAAMVRTSMCGINLGLAAVTSSPVYLSSSSISSSPYCTGAGPNRASPNSSPSSSSSTTFSLLSPPPNLTTTSVTSKETKPPNTKRSKSSSSSTSSSSTSNPSFKTLKHGHNASPNQSSPVSMNSAAVNKWNMVNNNSSTSTVLTGMGALSNANLLANNNHVAIGSGGSSSRLDHNNQASPQDSTFISTTLNIKSNLSSHLSCTSSPLLNGLGPTSSSPSLAHHQHHHRTNHILPANTANILTVNSDSPISNIDDVSLQTKGRGSRGSNACRMNKHQMTPNTSLSLGSKMEPDGVDPMPLKLLNSSGGGGGGSKAKSQKAAFGLHNAGAGAEFKRGPPEIQQQQGSLPT